MIIHNTKTSCKKSTINMRQDSKIRKAEKGFRISTSVRAGRTHVK